MRTSLIRRFVSLFVACMMLSLVAAPVVAADGKVGPVVTAPADQTVSSQQAAPYSGNYPYALGTFSDPNGVAAGPWTWTVTWGDGSTGNGTTSSVGALSSPHFYLPGTYRAHVVVTNAAGASGDAYLNVTVAGGLFVGLASVVMATEGVPTHLDFGFYDPYGPVVSGQYVIHVDWGDGSSQDLSTPNTSPFTLSHTYAASDPAPGNPGGTVYTATVTVTDSLGHTGSASRPEPVIDVAPVLTASPVAVPEGFSGQITLASFTDASVGPWSVFIDGGPGMQQQFQVQTPGPIQLPYDYSFGNHTFTIYVGDRGGLVSQATVTVTVGNSAPVIMGDHITPSPLVEGGAFQISATFSDPGLASSPAETYTCNVNYGDGSGPLAGNVSGDGCTGPVHTYPGLGPYTATVSVTDSQGAVGAASFALTVPNTAPVITMTSGPDSATTGVAVSAVAVFADPGFVAGGTNETYTCTVDYGDGTGPQAGSVGGMVADDCEGLAHIYSQAGAYSVTFRVVDSNGGVGTGSKTITVVSAAPIVGSVETFYPAFAGAWTNAWADFVPSGISQTYTCTVDFGDGSGPKAGTVTGTSCQGPGHVYGSIGAFTITVAVVGSVSGLGSASGPVTVASLPTLSALRLPSAAIVGSPVSASADFVPPGLLETYTCVVDYGDGGGQQAGVVTGHTCQGPNHVYSAPGTYYVIMNVIVWVTGGGTATASAAQWIYIGSPAPVVGAISTPSSVVEGTAFAASATFTPTGPQQSYSCTVDYGDGTGPLAGVVSGSMCQGPKHTYGRSGDFVIVVAVTGSVSPSGSASRSITVANVAPTVTKVLAGSIAKLGATVTATATFTDPGSGEAYQATWSWGDGTTTVVTVAPAARAVSTTHVYAKPGVFSVGVSVSDGMASGSGIAPALAVYDPARTLAASGSATSPKGACRLTTRCGVAGTAGFSFSASYAKNATTPIVNLAYSVTDFSFTANAADWFVAAAGTATIKGAGKVNGASGYTYQVVAVDSKTDALRMQVWNSAGTLVYDNGSVAALKAGSVTIK